MTPNNFSNISVATTLVSGIGVGDLSMTVADATGYPVVPFAVVIDTGSVANEEAVLVTAKAGPVWTISRAYDGTTAKVHSAGATVIQAALARDYRGLILGTREMSTALPNNGDAVVWNNGASQWEPGAVAPGGAAGGVLSGTYPNPGFAVDMATQAELDSEATTRASGDATNASALSTHAALTTTAHGGIVASTDPRLTDSRTPTGAAGGVLSGTYPNPGFAVDMATQAELDAAIAALVNTYARLHFANTFTQGPNAFRPGGANSIEVQDDGGGILSFINAIGGARFAGHSAAGADSEIDKIYSDGTPQFTILNIEEEMGAAELNTGDLHYINGVSGVLNLNPTADTDVYAYGLGYEVHSKSTNDFTSSITGLFASAVHDGSGNVATLYGQQILATVNDGSVANFLGNQLGMTGNNLPISTTKAIEIYFVDMNGATDIYGLYIGSVSGGSGENYAIWTDAGEVSLGDDLEFRNIGDGPVIKSSNGSQWRIKVDNAGNLSTEPA